MFLFLFSLCLVPLCGIFTGIMTEQASCTVSTPTDINGTEVVTQIKNLKIQLKEAQSQIRLIYEQQKMLNHFLHAL